MKYIFSLILFFLFAADLRAQKETFDIVTYTTPKGWKKSITENILNYSLTNSQNNTWCQIASVKSTISKGSIEKDFESECQELVVKNYKPAAAPETDAAKEVDGWKLKAGGANFIFNKKLETAKFRYSLNSILPGEITIKDVRLVSPEFHSRYSAIKREYIYKITCRNNSYCCCFWLFYILQSVCLC